MCDEFEVSFPLTAPLAGAPEAHRAAYAEYSSVVDDPKAGSYMFVDPEYRQSANHSALNLAELLLWSLVSVVRASGSNNFCATANAKYKVNRWIALMGDWPRLAPILHPSVPEPHDVVFIKEFSEKFYNEGESRYGELWRNAEFLGAQRNFARKSAAKKAA
jgi:hypothetical protein